MNTQPLILTLAALLLLVTASAGCLDGGVNALEIRHISDTAPANQEIIRLTEEDIAAYPALAGLPGRITISDNPFAAQPVLSSADAGVILVKFSGHAVEYNGSYYYFLHLVS